MELVDCAFHLLDSCVVFSNPVAAFERVDYVILAGAAPLPQGKARVDLLPVNKAIFQEQGRALDAVAKRSVKVIVVGNPANTNCLVCARNAPSIPRENFIAMTRLDHNRAVGQICRRLHGVTPRHLRRICVFGNHSPSMVPFIGHGEICHNNGGATSVRDMLRHQADGRARAEERFTSELLQSVRYRNLEIRARHRLTTSASTASAIIDLVRDLHFGTAEGDFVTMGVLTDVTAGAYGIAPGLCYSLPCECWGGTWRVVELPLTEETRLLLKKSEQELHSESAAAEAIASPVRK